MDECLIPEKDKEVILKAQTHIGILYKRYMKHLVGWKKGSETQMNQYCLLSKMQECVSIFCTQNLHLNDLSDNQTVDVKLDNKN